MLAKKEKREKTILLTGKASLKQPTLKDKYYLIKLSEMVTLPLLKSTKKSEKTFHPNICKLHLKKDLHQAYLVNGYDCLINFPNIRVFEHVFRADNQILYGALESSITVVLKELNMYAKELNGIKTWVALCEKYKHVGSKKLAISALKKVISI